MMGNPGNSRKQVTVAIPMDRIGCVLAQLVSTCRGYRFKVVTAGTSAFLQSSMWTWAASHWYTRPSAVRIAILPIDFRRVQPFGAGGAWGSSLEKLNSTTSGRQGAYCQGWRLLREFTSASALVWGTQSGSTRPLCPVTSGTWLAVLVDTVRVRETRHNSAYV